jgi:hypothetical protein
VTDRKEDAVQTSWGQVLENVQLALRDAEVKAAEHEEALAKQDAVPAPNGRFDENCRAMLEKLEERKRDWQRKKDGVNAEFREADAALKAAEENLAAWLVSLRGSAQKLATRVPTHI